MNKKVSIIIPVYNTEKYLEKCLDSIINQEYRNLEIIIVNDGSTDNSMAIMSQVIISHLLIVMTMSHHYLSKNL